MIGRPVLEGSGVSLAIAAPLTASGALVLALVGTRSPTVPVILAATIAAGVFGAGTLFGSRLLVSLAIIWSVLVAVAGLSRPGAGTGLAIAVSLALWLAADMGITSLSNRGPIRYDRSSRILIASRWAAVGGLSLAVAVGLAWIGAPVATRTIELDTIAVVAALAIVGVTAGLAHRHLAGR